MTKVAERYIKECAHIFPFVNKDERIFLRRLEDNLSEKDQTYEEICNEVGSPRTILRSYIKNCDDEYIIKKLRTKFIIKKIYILILLFFSVTMYCKYFKNKKTGKNCK